MTDIIVGLIVLVIVGAALLYIRNEKKKGVVSAVQMRALVRKNTAIAIQNNKHRIPFRPL